MRSVHELPGNPWPRDMVIEVDRPNHLLTLLFVRHAWNIAGGVEIPQLSPAPDIGSSAIPGGESRETWGRRWESAWTAAWAWYATREARDVLPYTRGAMSVHASLPPMWETAYGNAGLDRGALGTWTMSLQDAPEVPLDEQPERRSLDALIAAWKSGINHIIVLPYA